MSFRRIFRALEGSAGLKFGVKFDVSSGKSVGLVKGHPEFAEFGTCDGRYRESRTKSRILNDISRLLRLRAPTDNPGHLET